MNEEKFKLVLSAPVDKAGMVIRLTVSVDDLQILHINHYPEFMWYTFGVMGVLAGFFISYLVNSMFWIYCAIFLVVMLYKMFYERALICAINKKTGLISYHRSGVLMTSFDEQRSQYYIAEIKRLEMQRYVQGGRWSFFAADTFQIFMLLEKGQRVPLSSSNLDFAECQEFAEQIREFLGKEIPIKAVD